MQWNWTTVMIVQVFIWLIVLFEWRRLKYTSKVDKITFFTILLFSAAMSLFNLENLPGPITLLRFIFGPLGRMME